MSVDMFDMTDVSTIHPSFHGRLAHSKQFAKLVADKTLKTMANNRPSLSPLMRLYESVLKSAKRPISALEFEVAIVRAGIRETAFASHTHPYVILGSLAKKGYAVRTAPGRYIHASRAKA